MKVPNLKGIIAATVLPMRDDFSPDLPALRRYLDWVVRQGVVGVAINVDTGEGPHLSREERRAVLEAAVDAVAGRAAVVAGLAATYTAQAVELARDAQAAGADALLVFPIPAFAGQPLEPEVPYAYHAAIAEAVDLPLILFQLQPALGGVIFTDEALTRLVEGIDSVVAIKEASFDAVKFVQTRDVLRQCRRKITLLTGNDNFIYESFVLGAEGALIGFSAVATELQVRMHREAMAGNFAEAARIWERLLPLEQAVFAPPVRNYRARLKEALVMLGLIDRAVVRPPLLPVGPADRERIRRALVDLGLLQAAPVGD